MARTLPRTPRSRVSWTLALLATAALASAPSVLPAGADDLHDKKKHVHQDIKNATGDLEDSSKAVLSATHQLAVAQTKLAGAQRTLAATQGELTAAQVLDSQMQAQLAAAEAALTQAETDLANGIQAAKDQRVMVGQVAAANFQNGDPRLLALSAFMNAHDFSDTSTQLKAISDLMASQERALEDLKTMEALLEVQKAKVETARSTVAQRRQEAAVNLARKTALEQRAATNRAAVAALVGQRSAAAARARAARAADIRKLKQLKSEEARIKRMILARAKHNHSHGYSGASGGFLLPPVANSYVTSPYGWRKHPIYGYWGLHDGDDFHAPCGVPERASASGTIIEEYYSDVWGNRLFLDVGKVNGKSMTLIYNHISSYRAHTGERVRRGETIALAGTTGWSTACHLHFTVMINGTAVDPQNYM